MLAAHVNQLDGGLLPAIEGPEGEPARSDAGSRGSPESCRRQAWRRSGSRP